MLLADEELFLKRYKDTYVDGSGLILVFTDNDVFQMLECVRNNDSQALWNIFETKKRKVTL